MSDCIFCRIANHQLPAYKIYEDDHFLAFLDIYPLCDGHTLIIPKKHFRWVWQVEPADQYWQVIRRIAQHYQQVTGQEFIPSMTLGEEVPHAHYHLLPAPEQLTDWWQALKQMRPQTQLPDQTAQQLVRKFQLPDQPR